jgi:hypothetical protein
MNPILSQNNPDHILTLYLCSIHFNDLVSSITRSTNGLSLFRFSDYNFVRGNLVGIATCYRLDGRGSIPGGERFFSSLKRQERLWGELSLLSNGFQGLFLRRKSGWGVKLTTHLHLAPRSKMVKLYLHSPIRLHGVVLD